MSDFTTQVTGGRLGAVFLSSETLWTKGFLRGNQYYGGKHYESKYTGFIQAYYLFEKCGIDYRVATLSAQICAGAVTRDEALKELAQKPYDDAKIEQEKQYLCKKLGIQRREFDAIMAAPPKSYKEYPNSKRFLQMLYGAYCKLKSLPRPLRDGA